MIVLSGRVFINSLDNELILSCKFKGLRGTSKVAQVLSLSLFSHRGNTKIYKLPCYPSAVRIFIETFFYSEESTFKVVRSILPYKSSCILFSLQFLSSMWRMSTDWLLYRRIVSIAYWDWMVKLYAACSDIRFIL